MSGWNPFRKYHLYKKEAEAANKIMSIWDRFCGYFFAFSGYLFDPTKGIYKLEFQDYHGTNHWGFYDYLTLRIPRTIEDICLGNWCASVEPLKWACIITTFPIWIPLAIVRYGVGLLGAIMCLPHIQISHSMDEKFVQEKILLIEENTKEREFSVEKDSYQKNMDYFYKNVKKVKNDFKEEFKKKNDIDHHLAKATDSAKQVKKFQKKYNVDNDIKFEKSRQNLKFYKQKYEEMPEPVSKVRPIGDL